MATPSVSGTGTFTTGVDSGTIPLPALTGAGDYIVLFVGTEDVAVTVEAPANWERLGSSPSRNPVGPDICRLTVFGKRAEESEPDVDIEIAGSGNFFIAQTLRILGAAPSGNPWNITGAAVGRSFDPDAQAYIDADVTDDTVKQAITTMVLDLKDAGLWTKIPALWPAAGDTGVFNLKDPRDLDAAFRLTAHGGVSYNANGWTGNGTDGYLDTHFVPSAEQTGGDTAIAAYSRTSGQHSGRMMGAWDSGGSIRYDLRTRDNDDFWYASMYADGLITGPNTLGAASSDGAGFFVASRRTDSDFEIYKNGVSAAANATGPVSVTLPGVSMYLLATNNGGTAAQFSSRNGALWAMIDGLTDGEVAALSTIVQRFQTSLGREVGTPETSPGVSGTTLLMPGGTTTKNFGLAIVALATGTSADGSGRFSGLANSDLGSLTELIDEGFSDPPDDGALFVASGTTGAAGPFGETTVEMDAPTSYASWMGVIFDTATEDEAPPVGEISPAASLSDYEQLILADSMNVDGVKWGAEILRKEFGGGFGAFAVVGPKSGLHHWMLSAGVLPADDVYGNLVNGVNRFDYYFEFFKDHTTGLRDVFWIKFRGKRYHASWAEPMVEYERFTEDLFAGGVEIRQRRVKGIYYLPDGSIFYPSDYAGMWYLPEGLNIAELTWKDAGGAGGPDPDIDDTGTDLTLEGDVLKVADQCNGLSVARFNSVAGDGRAYNSGATVYDFFLLCKFRESTFSNNNGLVTGTGATSAQVLTGASGANKFTNQSFGAGFTYRLNGVAHAESDQSAPMDTFGVVHVNFASGINLSAGLQIAKKRTAALSGGKVDVCEMFFGTDADNSAFLATHMTNYLLLRGGPSIEE